MCEATHLVTKHAFRPGECFLLAKFTNGCSVATPTFCRPGVQVSVSLLQHTGCADCCYVLSSMLLCAAQETRADEDPPRSAHPAGRGKPQPAFVAIASKHCVWGTSSTHLGVLEYLHARGVEGQWFASNVRLGNRRKNHPDMPEFDHACVCVYGVHSCLLIIVPSR